jgi:hypothetical protein
VVALAQAIAPIATMPLAGGFGFAVTFAAPDAWCVRLGRVP